MRTWDVTEEEWSLNYFLTDHLGSTMAVLDDQGAVLSETRYLPFGAVRTDVGTLSETDFGYTFQRSLPNTGLMDYKARFYDPSLNRFLQPDTLIPSAANPQSWNRYTYVLNNPIMFNDPSGHKECNDDPRDCPAPPAPVPLPSPDDGSYEVPHNSGGNKDKDKDNNQTNDSNNLSEIGDFLSDFAYWLDVGSTYLSIGSVIVVDTIGALLIADACILTGGIGCLPAIGFVAAWDVLMSSVSPVGFAENAAGAVSWLATVGADFINGTNYIRRDQSGLIIGVGMDTFLSSANNLRGIVPEIHHDFYVNGKQLEYDKLRGSGTLPTVTAFEFTIPNIPNLWGVADCGAPWWKGSC